MSYDIWSTISYSEPIHDTQVEASGDTSARFCGYLIHYIYFGTFVYHDDLSNQVSLARTSRIGNSSATLDGEPQFSQIENTRYFNVQINFSYYSKTSVAATSSHNTV